VPDYAASVNADEIDAAAKRIAEVVAVTPLQPAPRLSTTARVYLKREDLQVVRSYKLRGAYNLMVQLTPAERAAGVVAASAGNHAQGVAFACRAMRIRGRIYVPSNTPKQKRDRIRAHGGEHVELIATGFTYDEAAAAAAADVARTGATMVPPFDDPRTIAGQGTVAAELLRQLADADLGAPDVVVVPVGGGGCLAGMAAYLRERSPGTIVVGVEPAGAASMTAALVAEAPVTLPQIDPFVDGAAVRRVGDWTYSVIVGLGATVHTERRGEVHGNPPVVSVPDPQPGQFTVMHVDEGAVCTAMLDLYQNEGIIAEPAGALAVTALGRLDLPADATVVCLVSGGNNDVSRYGEIIERSLVHLGLKHYFLVDFPQEPGALRRFLDNVLGPDDDITVFEYVKRNNRDFGPALVGIQLGSAVDLAPLLERIRSSHIRCERLDPGSPAYSYLT
jgi:threonine dehydratase